MANLTRIEVSFLTGNLDGAGTDGNVYLGVCGREFHCDTSKDDFERGSSGFYRFGEQANVLNADRNDPRKPQLLVEDADLFPAYVRFEQGSASDWNLRRVQVFLNGQIIPTYEFAQADGPWFGRASGSIFYLKKHFDPIPVSSPKK